MILSAWVKKQQLTNYLLGDLLFFENTALVVSIGKQEPLCNHYSCYTSVAGVFFMTTCYHPLPKWCKLLLPCKYVSKSCIFADPLMYGSLGYPPYTLLEVKH